MSPKESSDTEWVSLNGVIDRFIYQNEENHFCIAEVATEKKGGRITVTGTLPNVQCGETIEMKGRWKNHPGYGRQFEVKSFQSRLPSSVYGIRKYLGSGLIHGIGKTYADKIVAKFGAETLEIIQNDSGRLREVEGIGKKRAAEIKEAWDEQHAGRDLIMFLQTYGVSVRQCVRLIDEYGYQAKAVLLEDPYRIAREIDGIGFKTADQIALNLGFANESPQRLDAALIHVLKDQEMEGHTALPRSALLDKTAEMLQVHRSLLEVRMEALIQAQAVLPYLDSDLIQLPPIARAESILSRSIHNILKGTSSLPSIQIPKAVQWAEERAGFTFADEQRRAIQEALSHKITILTGGPGTGKTTILRSLVEILSAKKVSIALASPTGRAAQRLAESTRKHASTLHRLLKNDPQKGGFIHNEHNTLKHEFIIVDETSMLDTWMAQSLFRAIRQSSHVLLVGDVDQLPSVGCGNVLKDLIQSQLIPTVSLNKIFRQNETSNIVTTAHRILKGEAIPPRIIRSNDEIEKRWDLQFIEANSPQEAIEKVDFLCRQWIPQQWSKFTKPSDIQVLAPIHKGQAGIANFNQTLQKSLNSNSSGIAFGDIKFCLNDKVIQLRNNYDKGIFNGDMGIITHINPAGGSLAVDFDGRLVEMEKSDLPDLSLAYAISIHKSQGSEFPVVIIPLLTQHFILLQRNLLYTAITRGKKKVFIVGDPRAYIMAVNNDQQQTRHTALKLRLENTSTDVNEHPPR